MPLGGTLSKATANGNGTPETIEFEIGEISFQEAERLGAAGGGKYGALAEQLLQRLQAPNLQTLPVFSLPKGGELPERERRALCWSLNSAFRRARLPYRTSYSSERKIFFVVPKKGVTATKAKPESAAPSYPPKELRPGAASRGVTWTLRELADYARECFGVSVAEIKGRSLDRTTTAARAAFARYAINRKQTKNLAAFLHREIRGIYRLEPEPGDLEKLDAFVKKQEARP